MAVKVFFSVHAAKLSSSTLIVCVDPSLATRGAETLHAQCDYACEEMRRTLLWEILQRSPQVCVYSV